MQWLKMKIKKNREFVLLLIICTGVFLILYHKMLFGDYIYAYKDVGGDTLTSYIPQYIFNGEWIRSGLTSGYSLQYGLGTYIDNPIWKYILPYGIMFIFNTCANINMLLLCSLFVKIIGIAVFGYLYFKEVSGSKKAAAIGAFVWTFCGFFIVWGQHYQFATWFLLFTAGIYFLNRFIRENQFKIALILVLAATVLSSYYQFYMNGFFYLLYTIVLCFFDRKSKKELSVKVLSLAGMAMIACLLSMVRLMPALETFFSSTRTQDVVAGDASIPLFYDRTYILTFLGRFLSSNFLGTGNDYSGAYNYYESAFLSTSLIGLFAVIFLLYTSMRKKVLALSCVSILALMLPFVSQLLNMNAKKQRWSFLLCFMMVIAIVFFAKIVIEHGKDKTVQLWLKKSALIGVGCYGLIYVIMYIAHKLQWIAVDKSTFIFTGVLVCVYGCIVFLWGQGYRRFVWPFFCLVIFIECISLNYTSINQRWTVTKDEWEHGFYYDGTIDVVETLKESDGTLYRINKTYVSAGNNDAYIQGYNGMSSYSSVNSQELVNFYTALGYELIGGHSHWISFPYDDFYTNTILSVKYVIAKDGVVMDENLYEEVMQMGNFSVYENRYALPFGYLYNTCLSDSSIKNCTDEQRKEALTYGFYFTDGIPSESFPEENLPENIDTLSCLEQLGENAMTDIVWENGRLYGNIANGDMTDAMLTIPMIYDTHWKILVDGIEQEVYNINGGLIGAAVAPGSHEVVLYYDAAVRNSGVYISLVTLIVLAGYVIAKYAVISHRKKIK